MTRLAWISLALATATGGCALIGGLGDYYVAGPADASAVDGGADPDAIADAAADDGATSDVLVEAEAAAPLSRSCTNATRGCGAADASCCESPTVPGGTFFRAYDGVADGGYTSQAYPATVTTFDLDRYEITVGRFRQFYLAYPGSLPADGAGASSKAGTSTGWKAAWNAQMPIDRAALATAVACATKATFSATPGANEDQPMNCITWFEAHAFCIWDGGRLPLDVEWNFAAAGGDEQRVFPWSTPPSNDVVAPDKAVYGVPIPSRAGSKSPAGDGRWGHADLSGNLWEWLFDAAVAYVVPCTDCGATEPETVRATRGGCFGCNLPDLRVSPRGSGAATKRSADIGARCARDR